MGAQIKLLRELKSDEKLAPQCKIIYDELLKIGVGKAVDREEFVKILEKGPMVTRQPHGRILAYYTKPLKDDGILEVVGSAKESKPKAEKPAKEAAAKPEKPAKAAA